MSVYFARVKGYVKIGFSKDPQSRMQTLTTKSTIKPDDVVYSDDIDLYGWIPGDRKVERAMHKRFADLHVVGEWFWDADEYLELLRDDPYGALALDLPQQVTRLMLEYPHIPRARIVEVVDEIHAKAVAEPKSNAAIARGFFDAEFIERVKRDAFDRRDADRAYWRSQRTAA